jgi:hypothetical protein
VRLLDRAAPVPEPPEVVGMTGPTPPTPETERGQWLHGFVAALARRAARPGTFTVYEVAAETQLSDPPHHSLWGVGTGVARREGLIVTVAAVPSLRPRTAKSLVRLWSGARFAESDGAA